MNFVNSVCDIIFLSHAKAQRAQSFLLSTDYRGYTDFPRDPRDPWRHLDAPQGICFIMLTIVLHGLQGSAGIISTLLSLFLQSGVVNAC